MGVKPPRIGAALYNEFRGSLESFLHFLNNEGISYVEIGKDWIPTRRELGRFRDLLEIYELKATLHISDHYNLAELKQKAWKRNILGVLGDLSVCYDLEVESAVLHCGWVSDARYMSKAVKRFVEAYNLVSGFANDLNVIIGLENQCRDDTKKFVFQTDEDVNRLVELSEKEMFFVLDVGHLGRLGIPLEKMVSSIGDRLVEIHLHDYNELGRDHLPLGAGKLNKKLVFMIIEEKNPLVTIENKSVGDIRRTIRCLSSTSGGK